MRLRTRREPDCYSSSLGHVDFPSVASQNSWVRDQILYYCQTHNRNMNFIERCDIMSQIYWKNIMAGRVAINRTYPSRSIHMAKQLALLTLYHSVLVSNPAGGEILSEAKLPFIAQGPSCSAFHCPDMTEILLKRR